ncbi:MAG: PAS domain-containing sensor histidine kinase, partial [Gemmatimonadetes bacterium]|nr:PAS domain-containing sensor histidine kinase [Gemmatimonadota bacterium]
RPGGSGLGLAIVQRAVESHRGLVLVESAPGEGTTFTILLHAKLTMEDAA